MDDEATREPESQGSKEYSVQEFTGVEVSTAIEFEITHSPNFSVKAIGDDRLIKRLNVEVRDQTLKAGLDSGFSLFGGFRSSGGLKLAITMPQLRRLTASGAC